jgi:hypothetical protein
VVILNPHRVYEALRQEEESKAWIREFTNECVEEVLFGLGAERPVALQECVDFILSKEQFRDAAGLQQRGEIVSARCAPEYECTRTLLFSKIEQFCCFCFFEDVSLDLETAGCGDPALGYLSENRAEGLVLH